MTLITNTGFCFYKSIVWLTWKLIWLSVPMGIVTLNLSVQHCF